MAVLSLTKHEMYPAQLLAKKLNNRACSLIGTRKKGSFNESIALLTKALKLTVRDISENFNKVACDCEFCSLDACLTMEEEEEQQQQQRDNSTSTIMETDDSVVGGDNYWRRNSQEHNRNHFNTVLSDTGGGTTHLDKQQQQQQQQQHYSSSSDDGGFVFRRLLCINNHSIEEHHYMGFTLSVVILLNLALVHHMKAIIEDDETTSLTGFVLAMKLYELSYDEHIKQQLAYNNNNNNNKNSSSSSNNINDKHCSPNFRLTVIILNNLGEIHRVLGDQKKHMMCLHHLLSVIMYLVDSSNLVHVLDSTEFDGVIRNIVVDKISAPAA